MTNRTQQEALEACRWIIDFHEDCRGTAPTPEHHMRHIRAKIETIRAFISQSAPRQVIEKQEQSEVGESNNIDAIKNAQNAVECLSNILMDYPAKDTEVSINSGDLYMLRSNARACLEALQSENTPVEHTTKTHQSEAGEVDCYDETPEERMKRLNPPITLTPALDPDMPTQELRLHMGELTNDEILVARASIRWANSKGIDNDT